MLDKNDSSIPSTPGVEHRLFQYVLALFNLLFLTYVLAVGYYDRLALDDYSFRGIMRDYGFFSPFTFWYTNYQGRFGPQFLINTVLSFYKIVPSLFFYITALTALFIITIYNIIKYYLPFSKWELVNYSIFLFSALFLTTFEVSTFYWLNVSTMYFGGVLFALIGTSLLLSPTNNIFQYGAVVSCFLFVGSSSEHVGALAGGILGLLVLVNFYKSGYRIKDFFSTTANRKTFVACCSCCIAVIIMILAPGNKIRMSAFEKVIEPSRILDIAYNSSWEILYHIFFKLPYIVALIFPFLLLGTYLKGKIDLKRINFFFLLGLLIVPLLLLIFLSCIPAAYAMGSAGPLRSFVFISLFLVIILLALSIYVGYHFLHRVKIIPAMAMISVGVLMFFVLFSFRTELPLVKKYYRSDKARVALLASYQEQNRTEPALLQPLFHGRYVTLTDRFRILTNTANIPTSVSDIPLFVGDIMESQSWQNNHIKNGLGLGFDIALSPSIELSKDEIDVIKLKAEKSYETVGFKFYILNNYIYYQIHPGSYPKVPSHIYCRIQPVNREILRDSTEQKLFYDFSIATQKVKYTGDPGDYGYFIITKREITKFPIKKLETGFYDVTPAGVEYSNGFEIQF